MIKTFDNCVISKADVWAINVLKVLKKITLQISFFCGMKPECDIFGSEDGLKLAKSNVEKYYSVVGILEKWNESLEVMEHYIPRFFKNAGKTYKDYMKNKPRNKNNIKQKVSKEIKNQIGVNFTVEIEFYEFCKQRFYKQYLAIK